MGETGDWVETYVRYTDNLEPTRQYRRWAAIGCVAAALQRRCWVLAGHRPLYPNLYIVLVGPSGSGKTTALDPGLDLLRETEIPLAANVSTRRAFLNEIQRAERMFKQPDGRNATHHSLTVYSPELAVFFGRDNLEFMQELAELFDCGNVWEYKTANHGEVRIEGAWLNILGAMTPRGVHEILMPTAAGGGVASRIIFVMESRLGTPLVDPSLNYELHDPLLKGLKVLQCVSGPFKRSQGFIRTAGEWYLEHRKNGLSVNELWAGYESRKRAHLVKLSMVFCASRFDSTMTIEEVDFLRALDTLSEAEETMFKAFSKPKSVEETTTAIMKTIATAKDIRMMDLYRKHAADVGKRELLQRLSVLEKVNFCELEDRGELFVRYIESAK